MANVVDQDQQWLLSCLSATLDPNHEVRNFAEASLNQASLQPGILFHHLNFLYIEKNEIFRLWENLIFSLLLCSNCCFLVVSDFLVFMLNGGSMVMDFGKSIC